ncbi:MAG: G1 family glutamic endopeptidase [Solirubrobacteraceae bacterium]
MARAALTLCLLAACAALISAAAAPASSTPQGRGDLAALSARRLIVGPPPAPSMARARKARLAAFVRLTATPSTLPAAGGTVRLRARVRRATSCRFSGAGVLRKLRSIRNCASGRASVIVRVPRNRANALRRYVLYLTVKRTDGRHTTVREVVLERPRTAGVTAASGVNGGPVLDGQDALGTAPTVTLEPSDQSASAGTPVAFSAQASGTPTPSAQWQVSTDAGAAWSDTSPTFTATAAEDGYEYRAVFTNSAGSSTTTAATLTVAPMSTENFSGYIDFAASGQTFNAVSASWSVPTVTCQPGETSWAAQWPGIGASTSVEQVGTETDCFNGEPDYWAWYEMYGDPAVNNGYAVELPNPVAPGDEMTGSVSLSGSTWLLTLTDATQDWTSQTAIASPTPELSQASAEWMVEDPNGCSPQCETLAQYSPVQFSGASASADGQTGSIASFPSTAMAMDQNSTLLASLGPLDATGADFTDSWLAG